MWLNVHYHRHIFSRRSKPSPSAPHPPSATLKYPWCGTKTVWRVVSRRWGTVRKLLWCFSYAATALARAFLKSFAPSNWMSARTRIRLAHQQRERTEEIILATRQTPSQPASARDLIFSPPQILSPRTSRAAAAPVTPHTSRAAAAPIQRRCHQPLSGATAAQPLWPNHLHRAPPSTPRHCHPLHLPPAAAVALATGAGAPQKPAAPPAAPIHHAVGSASSLTQASGSISLRCPKVPRLRFRFLSPTILPYLNRKSILHILIELLPPLFIDAIF